MKIIRSSPERARLARRDVGTAVSDLFNRFFDDDIFSTDLMETGWNPRVDVYEKDNNVIVKADIPGIEEKNLNVEIEDHVLTIRGSKEEEHERKEKNYHQIERSYGSFCRSVSLPEGILPDKINADYKKGVLTVTIPKAKETDAKKISIKVS